MTNLPFFLSLKAIKWQHNVHYNKLLQDVLGKRKTLVTKQQKICFTLKIAYLGSKIPCCSDYVEVSTFWPILLFREKNKMHAKCNLCRIN